MTARKTTKPVSKAAPKRSTAKPAVKPAAKAAAPAKRGRPSNAEKAARVAAAAAESLQKQVVTNRYDAAGQGRRLRGWNPPSAGPNVALKGIDKVRDRSRDTTRNDWSGASGVQKWTTNLIGTGIVPRITRIKDLPRKIELIDLWNRWSRACDADGVLDFYGLQTLATREWIESGEVFVRLRYRRIDSGMEVPLQIQLIPADYVPMLDADNWPGLPSGNKIRSGIELRNGQRIAYWVYKEHPRDGQTIGQNDLIRVAASQMLHVYEPKRVGQLRGVPENAPVLVHLREVADYDGNVRERMRLSNLFAGFIERPGVSGVDDGTDPLTGQPIESDASGAAMVSLEPGTMHELLPGEKVSFANPPEPGTIYPDYMRVQDMRTAAGWGLPYELFSGDIKEVSDRTLRVLINDFRRYCEQRQFQIIIPQMCQKVREAVGTQAAIVGLVAESELVAFKEVTWQPQAWPYIHPVQDVQAKQTEVEALFRSRSSVIAERGEDPELVDQEISDDKTRAKKLDILPEPKPVNGAKPDNQNPDGDNIAPGEYPKT